MKINMPVCHLAEKFNKSARLSTCRQIQYKKYEIYILLKIAI